MVDTIGQDPAEVDELAAELQQRATELLDIRDAITARLTASVWSGPDHDRFDSEWSTTTALHIAQVSDALRGAAEAATQNAQEQRAVSGAA